MDKDRDDWLTVRNMQEFAAERRSEHAAIVELRNQPAHNAGTMHHVAIPQQFQRHGGRNDTKRA